MTISKERSRRSMRRSCCVGSAAWGADAEAPAAGPGAVDVEGARPPPAAAELAAAKRVFVEPTKVAVVLVGSFTDL